MSTSAGGGSGARPVSRSRSRSRSRANSYGGGDGYDGMDSNGGYAPGEADFCNSFWGSGHTDDPGMERGYEALMGRVKQAGKTTEEFRQFFKERAAIEEEYAKKMAKLARMPLGRDETGEFGNILRRVQYEADQSGRCHNELANVIRQTLEARVKEFEAARDQRRRNTQIAVERSWKNRQQQEALVTKAQEKYKSDCILINSFSARLSLTQGRDMDKVTSKLEKAQQTVQVNEAEYKNYLKALKDTQTKWVGEWKAWCDLAQDLEEERFDFTRNALWSYVNAVSLICVKDDESCENVRQTVEMCDVRRDLQRFVQKEGGGNMITDPPTFTDFSDGDKGSFPPVSHPAKFSRSSAKVEQAPFDGLERLQAAIYPQQNGTAASAGGRTGPKSVPVTPNVQTPAVTGGEERQRSHTPAKESRTPAPTNGTDATPQAAARPASPVKKSQTPAPAPAPSQSQAQIPDARAMAATSQPPPPPPAAFSASRPRPASRAGEREDTADSSSQTTAEVLQHKASQKRLSTTAGKTPGAPVSAAGPNPSAGSAPSPNYPYATPRTAKPFSPDSGPDLRESPSGVLPPASVSSGAGLSVPTKQGDAPGSAAAEAQKPKEDPLLAALAKLRSPSSAVDVLPPTSPGIPGGVGAIGLPGMARSPQPHLQQQQQRAYSPYGQSQPQTQPGMDGRARSPSMPHVQQQQQQQQSQYGQPQQRQPNMYPLPGQAPAHPQQQQTYTRPMSASMSHPAHMGTSSSPAPTTASVYTQARSRPSSPNPQIQQQQQQQGYQHPRAPSPSAAMMRPPSSAGGAAPSDVSLGSNVAGYGAAFPGERRLSMSIATPANAQPQQQQQQSQSRPSSPAIRSPPQHGGTGFGPPQQNQPMHPSQMRSPSPGPASAAGYPAQQQQQYAYAGQPGQQQQSQPGQPAAYGQQTARPQSAYQPAPQGVPGLAQGQGSLRGQGPGHRSTASYGGHASAPPPQSASAPLHQTQSMGGRPTTPLGGGISLDASGQVMPHEGQYGGQRAPQQQPYGSMTSPQQQQQSAGYRHGASIYKQPSQSQNRINSPAPPQAQQAMSPGGYGYNPQQQQQQGGAPPLQQQQPHMYQRAASPYQQPPATSPAPVQQQQQPGYQQGHSGIARSQSQSIGYGQQPQQQQQPGMPYQHQQGPPQQTLQASQSYRQPSSDHTNVPAQQNYASSPAPQHPSQQPLQAPPPSRAPTGQFTLSGHPILFAVKAIYKYDASSPEEFSFQKDDVIGVVETDEDGWWKGELLDPERARRSGGMLFPSNFTTFLD